MTMLLRYLGTAFLVGALILAVYMGVAVANRDETASTLIKLIPSLAFHAGAALAGILCFGIAHRITQKGGQPASQDD